MKVSTIRLGGVDYPRLTSSSLGAGDYMGPISLLCDMTETWVERENLDRYPHPQAYELSKLLMERAVKRLTPDRDVAVFSEVKLSGYAISEAIDEGDKAFDDIRSLLEKREDFAKVIRDKPADKSLIEWYVAETTKGFMSAGRLKTLRWIAFTAPGVLLDVLGAGGVGTMTGVGISAFDALMLDHLTANKKATLFVDETIPQWASRSD